MRGILIAIVSLVGVGERSTVLVRYGRPTTMDEDEAVQFVEDLWQGLKNSHLHRSPFTSEERQNETTKKVIDIQRWVTGGLDDER